MIFKDQQNFSKDSNKNIENLEQINMALASLKSCLDCIDYVLLGIKETCRLYKEGQSTEASKKFAEVVELIDLFIQLITSVHRVLKTYLLQTGKNVQELEMHLFGTIKALLPAKEKEDLVMLCDLLTYELAENLTRWKIDTIPEMRASLEVKSLELK